MKVLVACEFSGIVRDAFLAAGHDAISCDLLPTDIPGPHIQQDVRLLDLHEYDLMIAHPPCTHLAVSGARWFKDKEYEQREALEFVRWLMAAPVRHIAIENPVSVISSLIRRPDQVIQPYQFGHTESKATCLWLKRLPKLVPTDVVKPVWHMNFDGTEYRDKKGRRYSNIHYLTGRNQAIRAKIRSTTYQGIASAMAQQWGSAVKRSIELIAF